MSGLVTFTFDDGISKNTERLLEILEAESIKATFFIIGQTLAGPLDCSGKRKLQAIHEAGHTIGNHTYFHPDITKISIEDLRAEIAGTSAEIRATIDQPMKYFRPPYGAQNDATKKFITNMGFKIVLWNVDAQDWNVKNSKEHMLGYYREVFDKANPSKHSHIVLQHDRRLASIELVPEIAKIARGRGFKIVSLDEYYGVDEKKS
jgi:peptidoglycan/xylan/chitin deacetylase (PgdA/CDA1 family)